MSNQGFYTRRKLKDSILEIIKNYTEYRVSYERLRLLCELIIFMFDEEGSLGLSDNHVCYEGVTISSARRLICHWHSCGRWERVKKILEEEFTCSLKSLDKYAYMTKQERHAYDAAAFNRKGHYARTRKTSRSDRKGVQLPSSVY